jgi:hypothetical protein
MGQRPVERKPIEVNPVKGQLEGSALSPLFKIRASLLFIIATNQIFALSGLSSFGPALIKVKASHIP